MNPLSKATLVALLGCMTAACGTDSDPHTEAATAARPHVAPEAWPDAPSSPSAERTPMPEPTPEPAPQIHESEPNGWEGAATDLGSLSGGPSSIAFSGVCLDGGDVDFFRVDAAAGTLGLSVLWNEGEMSSDIDVVVFTDDDDLGEDTAYPPGDSPAEMVVAIPEAVSVYVEIDCYNNAAPNLDYSGTIAVE